MKLAQIKPQLFWREKSGDGAKYTLQEDES
jgi:hypothetical protein